MILEEKEESPYTLLAGDAKDKLKDIKAGTVDCIFTSPNPIRTYADFLDIVLILGLECKRVLKPTGSLWVHMEDSFNEQGSLMRWPAKFSMEMISEYNWILRAERIWHLPVGDMGYYNEGRVIDNNRLILDHCYVYHFTNARYGYYNTFEEFDGQPCSIFTDRPPRVGPKQEFATGFSPELIKQSLLMSCPKGGTVLDCFAGSGTTGLVALQMGMGYRFIGCEIDAKKVSLIEKRLKEITTTP